MSELTATSILFLLHHFLYNAPLSPAAALTSLHWPSNNTESLDHYTGTAITEIPYINTLAQPL